MFIKLNLHILPIKCFCYENKESNADFIVFIHGPWFLKKKTDISSITFFDYVRVFPLRECPFMISRQMYNSTGQKQCEWQCLRTKVNFSYLT